MNKKVDHGPAPGEGDGREDLLIRAGWLVTVDEAGNVVTRKDQVVACSRGEMVYAGEPAGLPQDFHAQRTIDARDGVVMPGMVNSHNHAAMTLLRGYADDMPLMDWLQEKVLPAEARLTGEDIYWGTLLAIAEQFRSGITTFADMYFFMDQVAQASVEAGARAYLCRGLIGTMPGAEQGLQEGVAFVERWHGAAGGTITASLGPHAPYTCPDAFIQEVLAEARRLDAGVQIHLAETETEVEQIRAEKGMSPIAWAAQQGILDRPVLAAHCVHLDADDIKLLAETGTAVSHNPVSNLKLASGIAPVAELLAAGVRVALGTDGACSTNQLNLFDHMRLAAILQKARTGNAAVVDAADVFRMATVEGAAACRLEKVGRIAQGWRADLVVVDLTAPHMSPHHDILSLLVYSARPEDVRAVVVDGRPVMVDRELVTLDEARIIAQCQDRARRLTA